MDPIRTRPAWALALVCAWMLAACGGSNDSSSPPPAAFTAETTSRVIGKSGGAVALTLANGTVFDFSLPAGAIKADTTFVLTTQEPIAGQRFNLRLQPEGLVFTQGKVATLLVTLPAGQSLGAKAGFAYRGKLVPFTVRPDGSVQIELTSLTGGHSAVASTGRAAALASRRPLAAPTAATCGGAPELGADGEAGLVAADAVEIEVYGQCMVAAVQALAANERFSEAVSAALSVAAYLQRTGSGDAGGFINRAGDYTCIAYAAALDRARDTTVEGMGTFYRVTRPIMFWEKVRSGLGFECPSIGDTTYQDVINDKVGQAIVYYESQKSAIVDTHDANYQAARAEAAEGSQTTIEVLALNPGPGLRATLDAQIVQRAQPSVLEALLQAPWASCRNAGSYAELIDLMRSLDAPPTVQRAAQYCATQIGMISKDKDDAKTGELAPALGGVSAASVRSSDGVYVPPDGKLVVSGPVGALQCPSGSGSSDEALLIKLNGVPLQTMSSPYFGSPLQIDVAQAMATAGLDPLTADGAPLTIERIGATCGGFWGDNPAPLVTIDLSFKKKMRVTPTRADQFCTYHAVPNVSTTLFATDLSMPFRFAQTACAISTHATTLTLTDPKTLVWTEDFQAEFPFGANTGGDSVQDDVFFDVDFPETGTLTLALDIPVLSVPVCQTDVDGSRVYGAILFRVYDGSMLIDDIGPCGGQKSGDTIAIAAGKKLSFRGIVGAVGTGGGMTTRPSVTLHFVANP